MPPTKFHLFTTEKLSTLVEINSTNIKRIFDILIFAQKLLAKNNK